MNGMTAEQYDAFRDNRRSGSAVRLSELSKRARNRQQRLGACFLTPLAAVVREAAERLRRRTLAEAAWARLVPPEWSGDTAVTSVSGRGPGTVTVTVSSSPLLFELRRRQAGLERSLVRLAPGLRRLRFVVGQPEP